MIVKRKPTDTDFQLLVEGVGLFRFARKTYGDHIKIRSEKARIVGLNETDNELHFHGLVVSYYKVLMVTCPDGWEDIEALDLSEKPEFEQQIVDVYLALKEKLDSFRESNQPKASSEGPGTGDLSNNVVLVSAEVPTTSA